MDGSIGTGEPRVRIGLVGYGWWGKTIARQLATSSWLQVAAVAEVDAGARAAMATDPLLAGVTLHDSADSLFTEPGLEAVILCTPHPLHAAQIVAAAEAGLHVFCEKPLCLTLDDARRAITACARRDRVLGIGHDVASSPRWWRCGR